MFRKRNEKQIMTIEDQELQSLIKKTMESEADEIMAEVNRDPAMRDVVAPEEMHEGVMQYIRAYEKAKLEEDTKNSDDNAELIRLGKTYKKKLSRRKYVVLAAAVVCALAVGTISLGDGEKALTQIQNAIGRVAHTRIATGDDDRFEQITSGNEEEAFEEIEEKFGFYPVQMGYLSPGMEFEEAILEGTLQSVRLYYTDHAEKRIACYIATSHRDGSVGTDIEDKLLQEYKKEVKGTTVEIQEYQVKGVELSRWCVNFIYKEAQYSIIMTGIKEQEVKKIVENLYFSKKL